MTKPDSLGIGPQPESELAGLVAADALGQLPPGGGAPRLEVREFLQDGEGVRGAALQVRVFDAAKYYRYIGYEIIWITLFM